jgi:hypothetical protein
MKQQLIELLKSGTPANFQLFGQLANNFTPEELWEVLLEGFNKTDLNECWEIFDITETIQIAFTIKKNLNYTIEHIGFNNIDFYTSRFYQPSELFKQTLIYIFTQTE